VDQDELMRRVARACESIGVRYFVTGSMATIFYGEPRFTNDIDVVVDLPRDRVDDFIAQFSGDEFYVSREMMLRAIDRKTQFNVIHSIAGLKVDVMIPAGDSFDRSRFARTRRLHPEEGVEVEFASPEDVIVKKMEYYRAGGSDKHLRDIAGVLTLAGDRIDRAYIIEWAGRLGLGEIWAEIVASLDDR
jgi:hypothetical protein